MPNTQFAQRCNYTTTSLMNKTKSNLVELPENKTIEIRDLRSSNHPEFEDFEDIRFHIKEAIKQNVLKEYDRSVFERVYSRKLPDKPISLAEHTYQLAGGA
ncbi:hypothetical protein [Nafulsella turpanensis]|uniref:hypothetical protein n=1 Tax=Nafulsella turpanensis TaxID=1265690 RepID=UPI0003810463|nr:hypothetical protein [Nafulsella turpanensis]